MLTIVEATLTSVLSLTCMRKPYEARITVFIFQRLREGGKVPKIKQLVHDGAQIQTQLCLTPQPILLITERSHFLKKPPP